MLAGTVTKADQQLIITTGDIGTILMSERWFEAKSDGSVKSPYV